MYMEKLAFCISFLISAANPLVPNTQKTDT